MAPFTEAITKPTDVLRIFCHYFSSLHMSRQVVVQTFPRRPGEITLFLTSLLWWRLGVVLTGKPAVPAHVVAYPSLPNRSLHFTLINELIAWLPFSHSFISLSIPTSLGAHCVPGIYVCYRDQAGQDQCDPHRLCSR